MTNGPVKPGASEQAAEPATTNRRAHARVEFDCTARVAELDETDVPGPDWDCEAYDLSRSGIGLRSRRMVYTGRLLLIELRDPGHSASRIFCGMVRQSRYKAGEGHILGIQFWALPKGSAVDQWVNDHRRAA